MKFNFYSIKNYFSATSDPSFTAIGYMHNLCVMPGPRHLAGITLLTSLWLQISCTYLH